MPVGAIDCARLGPGFHQIGDLTACGRFGIDGFVSATKEFIKDDIELHGLRLLSPSLQAAVPFMAYNLRDYRDNAHYPSVGGALRVSYSAVALSPYGVIEMFAAARLAANSTLSRDGEVDVRFDRLNGSVSQSALDQAWLKFKGLHIGYAPSYFGFNRFGYSFLPAYLTYVNLPLLAYTFNPYENYSLTLSLEDSSRRQMADGVLARYADRNLTDGQKPDFVAMGRYLYNKTSLFQISGALHQIKDIAAFDCCTTRSDSRLGWALAGGFESIVDWASIMGDMGFGYRGSLLGNIAYAKGAMSYLGLPPVVTDYVASSHGALNLSQGVSAVVGYRHFIAPGWTTSLTGNYFHVTSKSIPELELATAAPFGFNYEMSGLKGQLGLAHNLTPNILLGGELSYTWSKAKLDYSAGTLGVPIIAAPLEASYPALTLYARGVW